MSADGDISLEIENGIGLVTLNRRDARNTLSYSTLTALGNTYRSCDRDDAVKVVVVTGNGDSSCAGQAWAAATTGLDWPEGLE